MKAIVVLALTLAVFATAYADEDKKARILAFWKCLSCNGDEAAREEFLKCIEMRPEKFKIHVQECREKFHLEEKTWEERWTTVCKNEDGLREKFYDCYMDNERRKELNEDEQTQLKEFIKCAKKVHVKFCNE